MHSFDERDAVKTNSSDKQIQLKMRIAEKKNPQDLLTIG